MKRDLQSIGLVKSAIHRKDGFLFSPKYFYDIIAEIGENDTELFPGIGEDRASLPPSLMVFRGREEKRATRREGASLCSSDLRGLHP
jgi:hypothetical protein